MIQFAVLFCSSIISLRKMLFKKRKEINNYSEISRVLETSAVKHNQKIYFIILLPF